MIIGVFFGVNIELLFWISDFLYPLDTDCNEDVTLLGTLDFYHYQGTVNLIFTYRSNIRTLTIALTDFQSSLV